MGREKLAPGVCACECLSFTRNSLERYHFFFSFQILSPEMSSSPPQAEVDTESVTSQSLRMAAMEQFLRTEREYLIKLKHAREVFYLFHNRLPRYEIRKILCACAIFPEVNTCTACMYMYTRVCACIHVFIHAWASILQTFVTGPRICGVGMCMYVTDTCVSCLLEVAQAFLYQPLCYG